MLTLAYAHLVRLLMQWATKRQIDPDPELEGLKTKHLADLLFAVEMENDE